MTKWWAIVTGKKHHGTSSGREKLGPFATQEEALHHALERAAQIKPRRPSDVMTGYGNEGPYFDMRWHHVAEGPSQ
jgi:hypothetical protein